MYSARNTLLLSALLAAGLISLLWLRPAAPAQRTGETPLLVYAAAGLKPQVEAVAREYERELGVPVQLQLGGSGTLLGNLRVAQRGNLFIAGDQSHLDLGRSNKLVAEILPAAEMHAVVCVVCGNHLNIRSLDDVLRPDVRLALANPEAAAIGELLRARLSASGKAAGWLNPRRCSSPPSPLWPRT